MLLTQNLNKVEYKMGEAYLEVGKTISLTLKMENGEDTVIPYANGGWKSTTITSKSGSMGITIQFDDTNEVHKKFRELFFGNPSAQNNHTFRVTAPFDSSVYVSGHTMEANGSLKIESFDGAEEEEMRMVMTLTFNGKPNYTDPVVIPAP